jgi:hypothetical protein
LYGALSQVGPKNRHEILARGLDVENAIAITTRIDEQRWLFKHVRWEGYDQSYVYVCASTARYSYMSVGTEEYAGAQDTTEQEITREQSER